MKMKIQVDLLIPFNYHAIDCTTATSLSHVKTGVNCFQVVEFKEEMEHSSNMP